MKRFFLRLLLPLLVLSATAAHAQRSPAEVDIQAGFDRVVPMTEALIPVTVFIRNAVANTSGRVVISRVTARGEHEVETIVPFSSPLNSQKRVAAFVRPGSNPARTLKVEVLFDHSVLNEERKFSLLSKSYRIMLTAGPTKDDPICGRIGEVYRNVYMGDPQALPYDPRGYDAVETVLLSGTHLMKLDRPQVQALHVGWQPAGRIVCTGAFDEQPFERRLALLAGRPLEPEDRNRVLEIGAGTLFVTADSTTLSRNPKFLNMLFPLMRLDKDDLPQAQTFWQSGILTRLWSADASSGGAGFLMIFLIVLAYVIVVGPLDFYISKRTRKPGITWFLFLGSIAGFSVLAYAYTSIVNVGDMRVVTTTVIDVDLESQSQRGNSMIWVYSARNAWYTMESQQEDLSVSSRESGDGVGRDLAAVDITAASPPDIRARIPIFSSKTFDSTWYAESPLNLTVDTSGQADPGHGTG